MSAVTLDKRLQALEENSVCRIETLADYALWRANPNRDPNPEFSLVMWEALESFRTHTMEKKRLTSQDEGARKLISPPPPQHSQKMTTYYYSHPAILIIGCYY